MTRAETLRAALLKLDVNENFTEAVLGFRDHSQLCFCHRVGERWAKAIGPVAHDPDALLAGELLAAITMFRLNAKHLDIQFSDDSRWDEAIRSAEG